MSWNDTKMKEENKMIFHIVYQGGFEVSSRFGNFSFEVNKETHARFFLFFAQGVAGVEPKASCTVGKC